MWLEIVFLTIVVVLQECCACYVIVSTYCLQNRHSTDRYYIGMFRRLSQTAGERLSWHASRVNSASTRAATDRVLSRPSVGLD